MKDSDFTSLSALDCMQEGCIRIITFMTQTWFITEKCIRTIGAEFAQTLATAPPLINCVVVFIVFSKNFTTSVALCKFQHILVWKIISKKGNTFRWNFLQIRLFDNCNWIWVAVIFTFTTLWLWRKNSCSTAFWKRLFLEIKSSSLKRYSFPVRMLRWHQQPVVDFVPQMRKII